MESDRFRQLLDAPGPFTSIYFEDSHDTHDPDTQLDLKWRALREALGEQGSPRPTVSPRYFATDPRCTRRRPDGARA